MHFPSTHARLVCSLITFDNADLVIVGAGFYGMTIAERAAAAGFNVIVFEKRDHIGGNAYSYVNTTTGVEIHKYGPHVFHTNSEEVFAYLSRFTEWVPYEQRTWTISGGHVYPMPINLATICLFNGRVMSPGEARAWVTENATEVAEPRNLEEKAISLIGRPLYEAFVRGYTLKQWQTDPRQLPAEIITRLPVRYNYDNRYFNDTYQCMPRDGYTSIFYKMALVGRIVIHLGVDWFEVRPKGCAFRSCTLARSIDISITASVLSAGVPLICSSKLMQETSKVAP